MRKTHIIFIAFSVFATATIIGMYLFFLRKSVPFSISSQDEMHENPQEDVTGWEDYEDSSGLFTFKYPHDFILLKGATAFGSGVFCHKTSNWEEALKNGEGDVRLENCIVYHRVSKSAFSR